MFSHVKRLVEGELSGENAKDLTAAIHGFDRWSTFSQYRLCGNYCATRMREYGLEEVELMEIPADGRTCFGDWAMPLAWDVEDAVLEIVEPREAVRVLAHYREEPASLAMWSAPTPPGGIIVEVVRLEDGRNEEDYRGVEVAGKAVFTSQHAARVRQQAIRHGALGVISDCPACEKEELAEGVSWVNSWVDYHGWGFLQSDTPAFGFSLTREKGQYLRRLLDKGQRVKLRASVRSWLYDGAFTLPTGLIRGEGTDEVLVYAHSYEYGAEDNASGCAVALEAARTLGKLIREGKLPRPRRSIRFMMSWECYGSIPWCVQRIYEKRNVAAGLCLDSLGGKRDLTGGKLRVHLDSHAQASFADFAASAVAQSSFLAEEGFSCEIAPWAGGTDHTVFQDPAFGVPMPWLSEHPSRFHHTSLDGMDKIDTEGLRREGIFSATYLYFLASAGEAEVPWLARGTRELWEGRIVEVVKEVAVQGDAAEGAPSWGKVRERIEYLAERGASAIRSAARIGESPAIEEEVARLEREKEATLQKLERLLPERAGQGSAPRSEPAEGENLIPRRLTPGLLTLCTIPKELRPEYDRVTSGESPMWSAPLIFALFWADGRRTLGEIRRLVELELGVVKVDLVGYFRFLEKLGHIAWV